MQRPRGRGISVMGKGAMACCHSESDSELDMELEATPRFSRSCFTKSEDKVPKVPLLKYYTYNRGATAQVLSAGGPGLIAPGGTPGKIKLACTRRYGVTFWRQIRSI